MSTEHEAIIKSGKKEKVIKITGLDNGMVIDRIGEGESLEYIKILHIKKGDPVLIGMYLPSKKRGIKDIIKMENRYLSEEEIDRIAVIAHLSGKTPTISEIRNGKPVKKIDTTLPQEIFKVIRCSNPLCICSKEPHTTDTRFTVIKTNPLLIKCYYCTRTMKEQEITLL